MDSSRHAFPAGPNAIDKERVRIAVILPTLNSVSSRILTGIYQFMDEEARLGIEELPFRAEDGEPLARKRLKMAAAIIWADRRYGWVGRLLRSKVPVVNCNRDLAGEAGVVSLSIDRTPSTEMILNHLLSRRVRQFAAVGVDFEERPQTAQRCRHLAAEAEKRGVQSVTFEITGAHPDDNRRRISHVESEYELLDFLRSIVKPTAVWCENDYVARMVCNAAEFLQINVPEQLSVMGGGDHRIATSSRPQISTLPIPIEDCGFAAARAAFEWCISGIAPPDLVVPASSARVITRDTTREQVEDDPTIDESMKIIEKDACEGLSVQQLCDQVGLSRMTLTKRFLAAQSVTPGAQIRHVKAEHAKRLLSQSDKSIAAIAAEIGFSDQSKFGKFFRRETGHTPSAFRRSSDWKSKQ